MLEVFYVKMSNLCSYSSRIFYKCFLRKCNKKRKTGGGFYRANYCILVHFTNYVQRAIANSSCTDRCSANQNYRQQFQYRILIISTREAGDDNNGNCGLSLMLFK